MKFFMNRKKTVVVDVNNVRWAPLHTLILAMLVCIGALMQVGHGGEVAFFVLCMLGGLARGFLYLDKIFYRTTDILILIYGVIGCYADHWSKLDMLAIYFLWGSLCSWFAKSLAKKMLSGGTSPFKQ